MSADWLFKKEEYTPLKDKERFIDKSILTLLNLLGRVKRDGYRIHRVPYTLNSILKVVFTLINILAISISRSYIFLGIVTFYAVIYVLTLDAEDRNKVLIVSLIIPSFTLIMLLPSMFFGNINNNLLLINKIFCTIILINVLSYSTKWSHITRALKFIRIPDLFIWVMDITIKYIVLLGEYALWCFYSLKLRSIGVNKSKQNSVSKIIGNLFLKSQQMGEEMFAAMECRGFTGEYELPMKFKITYHDSIYIIINIVLIIAFIIFFK